MGMTTNDTFYQKGAGLSQVSFMAKTAPALAKLRFLPSFEDPLSVWRKCVGVQEEWEEMQSSADELVKWMEEFNRKMVVKSIWTTNVLEDTLPEGAKEDLAKSALSKAYDSADEMVSEKSVWSSPH